MWETGREGRKRLFKYLPLAIALDTYLEWRNSHDRAELWCSQRTISRLAASCFKACRIVSRLETSAPYQLAWVMKIACKSTVSVIRLGCILFLTRAFEFDMRSKNISIDISIYLYSKFLFIILNQNIAHFYLISNLIFDAKIKLENDIK